MIIKKLLIKLLIGKGYITAEESYYGDVKDYRATREAQDDIATYLANIDYNRSDTPQEFRDAIFNGTYCEDSLSTFLMCRIAFMGDKDRVLWKLELGDNCSICDIVNYIVEALDEK